VRDRERWGVLQSLKKINEQRLCEGAKNDRYTNFLTTLKVDKITQYLVAVSGLQTAYFGTWLPVS
jgi:hypothetical protein